MGLFDSLTSLVVSTSKVVTAPVEMAADLADAALKPVVDELEELKKDVKSLKE